MTDKKDAIDNLVEQVRVHTGARGAIEHIIQVICGEIHALPRKGGKDLDEAIDALIQKLNDKSDDIAMAAVASTDSAAA